MDPPSYGYQRDGKFYRPTSNEIVSEFFRRLNPFRTRKAWLPLFSWITTLSFAIPLTIFFTRYASWPLALAGFIYSMVVLGSHGTFWLHRYGTHRAFRFKNRFWTFIARNLVIKIIPEETYIVSHYVHHQHSEQAGDPYNAHGGWLYCFLADVNHQAIRRDLSPAEYHRVVTMVKHTGVRANGYAQYLKWGSICHPAFTALHFALNWAFWYAAFFALGGHALATALFGWAGVWAVGVRTFNYEGHGRGRDRRRDGIDFCRDDWSVNQAWPGIVAGEWHNNHHLFPSGARCGFLANQVDLPWYLIRVLAAVGVVVSYRDYKAAFMRDYYLPYQAKKAAELSAAPVPTL